MYTAPKIPALHKSPFNRPDYAHKALHFIKKELAAIEAKIVKNEEALDMTEQNIATTPGPTFVYYSVNQEPQSLSGMGELDPALDPTGETVDKLDVVVMEFCVEANQYLDFEANYSLDTEGIADTADVILALQPGAGEPALVRARTAGAGEHQSVSIKYFGEVTENTDFRLLLLNLDSGSQPVMLREKEGQVSYRLFASDRFGEFTNTAPASCAAPAP